MRVRAVRHRYVRKRRGDGFADVAETRSCSQQGDLRLPIELRRIKVRRERGGVITLLTNDCDAPQ